MDTNNMSLKEKLKLKITGQKMLRLPKVNREETIEKAKQEMAAHLKTIRESMTIEKKIN